MNEQSHRVAQPLLIVMCGLPRSGKSTAARSTGFPIVSPDALRLALHGERFNALAEPMVWAIAETMVRALFEAGHAKVIVDATNVTQKRRRRWISPDWTTEFWHVETTLDTCAIRAMNEADEEIIPVIRRMGEAWEPFEAGQTVLVIGP